MSNQRLALIEFDMGWSMWLTKSHLPFHIGRHVDNDLRNSSNCVSRKHCKLDMIDGKLHIVDTGSLNGIVLHNRVIHNSILAIEEKTCLLLSDMMLWITPCDAKGLLIQHYSNETTSDFHNPSKKLHGVCLVDICDSMKYSLKEINDISQVLRTTIIGHEPQKLLLIKYMGDGYLAVFDSELSSILAAKRLLSWQASNENNYSVDIRVSLDAGMTYRSYGHDRTGIPICRATRIEKTQRKDIDIPSKNVRKLKNRNRCLFTEEISHFLDAKMKEPYTYIGRCKLKGFADQFHLIYQYGT